MNPGSTPVPPPPSRLLLVEDSRIFATLLAEFLGRHPTFEVVAVAHDGIEGLRLAQTLKPDLMLVDLSLPGMGGLELLEKVQQIDPKPRVLILSGNLNSLAVEQALRLGIHGALEKTAPFESLLPMLERVRRGEVALGPEVSATVRDILHRPVHRAATREVELQVIKCLRDRRSTRQIAAELGVSVSTVHWILVRLRKRFGFRSRAELADLAEKLGLNPRGASTAADSSDV